MILQILKSILLVCSLSSAMAYIGTKFTSRSFVEFFVIATILQFIFFYFYNNIISYVTRLNLEKENLETIKLLNTNNILINCEACKKMNNVQVNLSVDNEFTCEHCKSENILNVEFSTIVKTKI